MSMTEYKMRDLTVTEKVRAFLESLEEQNLPLPIRIGKKGWTVDTMAISSATGIAPNSLELRNREAGALLKAAVVAWKAANEMPPPSRSAKRAASLAMKAEGETWKGRLTAYGDSLRVAGRALPRSLQNPHKADMGRIAVDCEVPMGWLLDARQSAVPILEGLMAEFGLEPIGGSTCGPGDRTYGALQAYGLSLREQELLDPDASEEARKIDRQQWHNTKWAFLETRRVLRKEDHDEIGAELRDGLEDAIHQVIAASNWADATAAKYRTEMKKRWAQYANRMTAPDDLPADGVDVVAYLMEKRRITLPALCIAIDATESEKNCLRAWLNKDRIPSRLVAGIFDRIETFFGLPLTTISGRIRFCEIHPPVDRRLLPASMGNHILSKIRRYLPENFAELPEEKRFALIADIRAKLSHTDIEYRHDARRLSKSLYLLKWGDGFFERGFDLETSRLAWSHLSAEWWELREFKTATQPPIDDETGLPFTRNSVWNKSSVKKTLQVVRKIFGAAALPHDKGGLALAPEDATLALFAFPKFHRWFTDFFEARRGPSNAEIMDLVFASQLLRSSTGFLSQRPHLVERLEFLNDFRDASGGLFISGKSLQDARTDWSAWCTTVNKVVKDRINVLQKHPHPKRRDPFDPIRPILESDSPLTILGAVADIYRRTLPDPRVQKIQWARKLQASLVWDLTLDAALRIRNVAEIDIRPTALNCIRKVGDVYVLKIFGDEFKNHSGDFFRRDGQTIFVEFALHAELTPWIDLFLSKARPALLAGQDCSSFFVKAKKGSTPAGAMSPNSLSLRIRELSGILAYNPITGEGIPGVERFGSHALRDGVATHVLKHYGSIEEAAALLTDTPKITARHYAAFTSSDAIASAKRHTRSARLSVEPPPRLAQEIAAER